MRDGGGRGGPAEDPDPDPAAIDPGWLVTEEAGDSVDEGGALPPGGVRDGGGGLLTSGWSKGSTAVVEGVRTPLSAGGHDGPPQRRSTAPTGEAEVTGGGSEWVRLSPLTADVDILSMGKQPVAGRHHVSRHWGGPPWFVNYQVDIKHASHRP